MLKLLVAFVAIALASCAVNTGIVPYGPNTFVVARQAATGFSGSGDLKAEALREADQHCKTLKKAVSHSRRASKASDHRVHCTGLS
jgi:hypothetical protein